MTAKEKKLGVYLCGGCGIAEAASLDALEKVAVKEFKAPFCKKHDYLCGEEGLKLIRDDAAAGTMNQAVIAACSPRVNQDKFRFDGVQVVRANLREQVAWTQAPGKDDTEMAAADYIRMAITEARKIKRAGAVHRRAVQRAHPGCRRRLDRASPPRARPRSAAIPCCWSSRRASSAATR